MRYANERWGRPAGISCQPEKENGRNLLAAAGHVVDEGAIDVGAAGTDPIQQSIEVGYEVLPVRKFFVDDLSITGIAQHHQASRNPYRFSPRASGHWSYTDPF